MVLRERSIKNFKTRFSDQTDKLYLWQKNFYMQFPSPVSAQWIGSFIKAEIAGNENGLATGINEIHNVINGDIVFVDHPKYYETCLNSAAKFIIINKKKEVPAGKTLFIIDDPFEAYSKIVTHFRPFASSVNLISDSATIGKNTTIMPNVFLGNHVKVGDNCIIHPNVSVYDYSVIGNNVEIHSGTVIGSDAFYLNTKKNRKAWHKKMPSCGTVVIEDDVEIGANCTIDRGVSDATIIGMGSRFDNLVHIGHEVVIGKNCILAAQVGIAGGTNLGDGVILWGQVGVNKTISIGENAIVMGQAGITSSIEGNKMYWGTPIQEFYSKRKELVLIKRLPEIWEKVKGLTGKS
jgi:UDP-3-O-[3-hydroxymyristoyl] glucosamine N-acyltransferase